MRSIWITGAKGFIGRHLARSLCGKGYEVAGIGHGHWPMRQASEWGLSAWLNCDISGSGLDILKRVSGGPDFIYHLAGGASVGASIQNPIGDFRKTVDATSELLEWVRRESPTSSLLVASSAAVYGAKHSGQIDESDAKYPYSPYGYNKHIMEELCRSYAENFGLQVVIARLFSVYGQHLRKQLIWDICSMLAESNDPLTLGGSGDELRDWTEVRDVVKALTLLSGAISTKAPAFNVGTGVGTTVKEIATAVREAWFSINRGSADIKFNGRARAGDPFSLIARPSRLADLGMTWRVDIETGMRDYVRWFLEDSISANR